MSDSLCEGIGSIGREGGNGGGGVSRTNQEDRRFGSRRYLNLSLSGLLQAWKRFCFHSFIYDYQHPDCFKGNVAEISERRRAEHVYMGFSERTDK